MAQVALTRKFKSKVLLWAIGDLLSGYVNALKTGNTATANTELASVVTKLKAAKTKDISITMKGKTVETEYDGLTWGNNGSQYVTDEVSITGKVAFASSGTKGTPPSYRELFLMAGFAEVVTADTKVTYQPVTTNFDKGVIGFVMDGQFHIGHMAQAEIKLSANAGELGWWDFEISMVGGTIPIAVPAGLNLVAAGYTEPAAINFSNTPTFKLGGADFACSKFELTAGNEVTSLDLVNHQSTIIGDRKSKFNVTIGAKDIATFNPYQQAWDGAPVALVFGHGTQAGNKISISSTAVRLGMPNAEDISGALGYSVELTPMTGTNPPFIVEFE